MLRLIVDESTGVAVANYLKQQGHDVLFVGEVMFSADDTAIITTAVAEQRIIVTNDKDFGDKVYRDGHTHAGIILLRLADDRVATKLRVIETLLTQYEDKVANRFVVATERTIRIR